MGVFVLCINQSINYFTRRVTAGWSQHKTTRVIKVCCTNGIHLQIKTQNNFQFKLQHRYLIVVQAYKKIKKKKNAGNPSIWKIKCMQTFGKKYSIKAMRI